MFDKFQEEVVKFITGSMGRWFATSFFFMILCFSSANLSPLVATYMIYFFAFMAVLSSIIAFSKAFGKKLDSDDARRDVEIIEQEPPNPRLNPPSEMRETELDFGRLRQKTKDQKS